MAGELRWLMDDLPEVVLELVSTLRRHRGQEAKAMLRELCALRARPHWTAEEVSQVVREAAITLSIRLGRGSRSFLGELAERPEVASALAEREEDAEPG